MYAVIKTLVDCALYICKPQYLGEELKYLDFVLQANRYAAWEGVFYSKKLSWTDAEEECVITGTTFLFYIT